MTGIDTGYVEVSGSLAIELLLTWFLHQIFIPNTKRRIHNSGKFWNPCWQAFVKIQADKLQRQCVADRLELA